MRSFIQVNVVGRNMPTYVRIDSIVQVDWIHRGEGEKSWTYLSLGHAAADEGLSINESPPEFIARLERVKGGESNGS